MEEELASYYYCLWLKFSLTSSLFGFYSMCWETKLVGRSLLGGLSNNLSAFKSTPHEMTSCNFLSQVSALSTVVLKSCVCDSVKYFLLFGSWVWGGWVCGCWARVRWIWYGAYVISDNFFLIVWFCTTFVDSNRHLGLDIYIVLDEEMVFM